MICIRLRTACFMLLIVTLFNGCGAKQDATTAEVLKLIPPDAVGLVTFRPSLVAQDETIKMMPLEVVSAAGLERLGLDPLKIERIDVIIAPPGAAGPEFAALVSYGQDIPEEARQRLAGSGVDKKQGLDLLPVEGAPGVVAYFKGPRQALVGTEAYVLRLLTTKLADGELRQRASGISELGHLSVVVALEPMREMLTGKAQSLGQRSSPKLGPDLATLAAKTKMASLRVQLGPKPEATLELEAGDESDAAEIDECLARLTKMAADVLVEDAERLARDESEPVPQAMLAYVKRLTADAERQLDFQRTGNRLVVKLDAKQLVQAQVGVLSVRILPTLLAASDAGRRMQSTNNLKQIMLAIHNYESTYKRAPGDADATRSGQPSQQEAKLSWRVKILPFVEQAALYNQFHLDEPWDSPHNIKLVERMPPVFKHPQSSAKAGHTVYQMPTGEHLACEPGKSLTFGAFSDGLGRTVGVVETIDAAAVPWTKPGDVDPLAHPEVLRQARGAYQIAFMDGRVITMPADAKPEQLRALFTRDGND